MGDHDDYNYNVGLSRNLFQSGNGDIFRGNARQWGFPQDTRLGASNVNSRPQLLVSMDQQRMHDSNRFTDHTLVSNTGEKEKIGIIRLRGDVRVLRNKTHWDARHPQRIDRSGERTAQSNRGAERRHWFRRPHFIDNSFTRQEAQFF